MATKATLKAQRTEIEALNDKGVKNKDDLTVGLPKAMDFAECLDNLIKVANECKAIKDEYLEELAQYLINHPSVCDEPPQTDGNGVTRFDYTINDVTYHLSKGKDGIKLISGGKLTQDVLSALPKKWVKTKVVLDVVGINRLGVTDEELEEKGLHRPEKNVWSIA